MITYIKYGNIFKIDGVHNYGHGCNCSGAMGKGIALQFRKKFPELYIKYKMLCDKQEFCLGDVFLYRHKEGFVFNLATQRSWKHKAELDAINKSIKRMFEIAFENNILKIALPTIGAGLGGLNWLIIKDLIEKIAFDYPSVDLFIVENYQD